MDFRFSAEAQAIRDEADAFVKSEWQNPGYDLTGGLAGWHGKEEEREAGHEVARQFAKKLIGKGWYTMHWPSEYGGQDASIEKQLAYREVMSYNDAPAAVGGGLAPPRRRRGAARICRKGVGLRPEGRRRKGARRPA